MIDDYMKWVVKRILDKWFQWEKMQYLVKWDEYSDSENIWESAKYLKAVQQFDIYEMTNSAVKKHSK